MAKGEDFKDQLMITIKITSLIEAANLIFIIMVIQ